MRLAVLGTVVEVEEGDLLLQRWKGFWSWVTALPNDHWSHVSIIVRGADGAPALVECTNREWQTTDHVPVRRGVGYRVIGDGFDGDDRCERLAIARATPRLTAAEQLRMRAWWQTQLDVQLAAPERSLYDRGIDLMLVPFGCDRGLTSDRFTCSEFVARAYAAAGRWPLEHASPLIPPLLRGLEARIVVLAV